MAQKCIERTLNTNQQLKMKKIHQSTIKNGNYHSDVKIRQTPFVFEKGISLESR